MRRLFTSESVTEGHPDKVCDQISDAVLDAMLAQDPQSRVACETCATTGMVMVMGEITTKAQVSIPDVVRGVVRDIGYTSPDLCFDADSCAVLTAIHTQSPDIAMGVDDAMETRGSAVEETGAGDQGMMFGFACDETPELMPMPIALAHRLTRRLAQVRKNGSLPYLRPDGKSQVTVVYEDGRPVAVDTVVISTQHDEGVEHDQLEAALIEHVINPVLAAEGLKAASDMDIYVNPTGRFVIGGPMGDTGLTGRKIIVDTYGGMGRHGGGAFSGKDCTKVDRSAAYAARWVAKNVVAAGLADRCEVQIAYAIGMARPVSIMVDTFGTEHVPVADIEKAVSEVFDLRPAAIIDALDLRRPIYRLTSNYGHFGRELPEFTWERRDKAEALRKACGLE